MPQVMSFNLTEKKISETFQNLLQKSDTDSRLYDLEGNYVTDFTIDGTISASRIQFDDGTSITTTSALGNWTPFDTYQTTNLDIRISGVVSASGDFITEGKLQLGKLDNAPSVVEGGIYYNDTDGEFYLGKN